MRRYTPITLALFAVSACTENPLDPTNIAAPPVMTASAGANLSALSGAEIVDLGAFSPMDINNHNDVLGSSSGAIVLWHDGTLTPFSPSGFPYALNDAGQIVGTMDGFDHPRAGLWQNGVGHPLPDILPSTIYSRSQGINNAGVAVGHTFAVFGQIRPVVWAADGTPALLGMLPGWSGAQPVTINNNGWIAGYVYGASSPLVALWRGSEILELPMSWVNDMNDAGTLVGNGVAGGAAKWSNGQLTLLPGVGGAASAASGINGQGEIVGFVMDASYASSAAYWSPDDQLTVLDALPGFPRCIALAINNNGWVVGRCYSDTFESRGVLWKLHPPTPEQLLDQLQAEVAAISGTNTRSLMALLDNAEKHYARNRGAVAPLLQAFITQVENMLRRGDLTAAQAESLIKKARQILAQL